MLFKNCRSLVVLTSVLTIFGCSTLFAQDRTPTEELVEGIKSRDGRWFEVELILFARNDNLTSREQFDQKVKNLQRPRQWDLIRDVLQPDISLLLQHLPECHTNLDPFRLPEDTELTADEFYQQFQTYQSIIYQEWLLADEYCLMPNESLTGIWQLLGKPPTIEDFSFDHIPLESVPNRITAGDYDDFHDVYVIAEHNLKLKSHYRKLQQNATTQPLLHIGWRQPGLAKSRSVPVYLFAGNNYSDEFHYDGTPIIKLPEPEVIDNEKVPQSQVTPLIQQGRDSVAEFMKQLQNGAKVDFRNSTLVKEKQRQLPNESWQLDGYIRVHLDHYLYINSEFNYRQPETKQIDPQQFIELEQIPDNTLLEQEEDTGDDMAAAAKTPSLIDYRYLKTYSFDQNRRLYSGDLHYLDHPKFGILVQIRKYRH